VKGSLKLCALESIFRECIHQKYRSNILFLPAGLREAQAPVFN